MFSWLVDTAYAMGGPAAQSGDGAAAPNPVGALMPFILIMVVFYFLFFRPQQKKAKEHEAMINAVERGDEVITSGGILGKVTGVTDELVTVEVAQGVKIKMQKRAIQTVHKGTAKKD